MEGRSRTPLKFESCVDSLYAATMARSLVWFRCTNQHIKAVEEASSWLTCLLESVSMADTLCLPK